MIEFLKISDSWITSGIVYLLVAIALWLFFSNSAKIFRFIGEVKTELRKASWPWDPDPKVKGFKKYKELIDSTVVVLIAIILLAAYVGLWDLVNTKVVRFLSEIV
ncbi:preprotein translocase subunit SecE [bacterium]|nr:preprotein translocase subunit SecE [Akkermansiaceae bacterium]MDA7514687.1 preprotein translocase subunit SecE [bacterium]MDA7517611.1 preprotein translocase subunit SecE [Akkermansiaceae bacterium]MDA7519131.1 preprotein translocase subunit SecE [Akkermansiaceae bacterium]MDA7519762.1 preprotein translocase subunit SecE [bacterium]